MMVMPSRKTAVKLMTFCGAPMASVLPGVRLCWQPHGSPHERCSRATARGQPGAAVDGSSASKNRADLRRQRRDRRTRTRQPGGRAAPRESGRALRPVTHRVRASARQQREPRGRGGGSNPVLSGACAAEFRCNGWAVRGEDEQHGRPDLAGTPRRQRRLDKAYPRRTRGGSPSSSDGPTERPLGGEECRASALTDFYPPIG